MSDVSWSAVADLFADLLELPPEERLTTLSFRVRDPAIRSTVERLLAAHETADPEFLDRLDGSTIEALVRDAESHPDRVGPYSVIEEVGRGGMGAVYRAERADGLFEQTVAVKMLKRGMDSEAVLRRFLQERQILAGLEHPNIARLLDGGIAPDGRPYLVMEFVSGVPITRFVRDHDLDLDARLDLFRRVCGAVAHAHRNLVVHRDLKPSNILVGADGEPKLLDFGIAKVLEPDALRETTRLADRMLTPEYAAPEQVDGGAVTTSTDVYGLGRVLADLSTVSDAVPRDLDTIIGKALRTEPGQRYSSVEALEDDVHRFQDRKPVRARPATISYRVGRFVQRHRGGVAAGATALLLILGFGLVSSLQAVRIRAQARDLAVERERAEQEAAASQEVAQFLIEVFQGSDPLESPGDTLTARALLERGAERIDQELSTDPELRARLLDVMATAHVNLGVVDLADSLALASVLARLEAFGEDDPRLADSYRLLGRIRTRANDFERAEPALDRAIELQTAAGGLGLIGAMADYAAMLHGQGRHREASEYAKQVAERLRDLPGGADSIPRLMLWDVAATLEYAGDWEAAFAAYQHLTVLEGDRGGPGSARVATGFEMQAGARLGMGDLEGADSLFGEALAIREVLAPTDLPTGRLLLKYADLLRRAGGLERADSLMRAALVIYRTRLVPGHTWIADAEMGTGQVAMARGDFDQASAHFQRAAESYRANQVGQGAVMVPVAQEASAEALLRAGRLTAAESRARAAVATFEATYPDDYILTANARRTLGSVLLGAGRPAEALPLLEAALVVLAGRWGEEDVRADDVRIDIADACIRTDQTAQAQAILDEVLPRLEEERGSGDPVTARARSVADRLP